ncbi:MAG: hypothetical protein BGO99_03985 [Nitrosospira sp. 56-18]|nr:MAG: hypothetical protein BGO99_03985 [Nitrosospira sp. 56-18]
MGNEGGAHVIPPVHDDELAAGSISASDRLSAATVAYGAHTLPGIPPVAPGFLISKQPARPRAQN